MNGIVCHDATFPMRPTAICVGVPWSDPVKVKHREERLETDTYIFFRESKFADWSAYGAI